jgi:hypothetical protein
LDQCPCCAAAIRDESSNRAGSNRGLVLAMRTTPSARGVKSMRTSRWIAIGSTGRSQ